MACEAAPRFRLVQPEQLHWRHWDEWSLLFQAASGDTHLLNPSAVALLRRLQETPASEAQLVAQWTASHAEPIDREQLSALLVRLEQLGLIESVSS